MENLENKEANLEIQEENKSVSVNDELERYKDLLNKQSELIDKLSKQQDLTNKVNEQLNRNIKEQMKQKSNSENPFEWIDEKIKNFNPKGCMDYAHFEQVKRIGGGLNERALEFHIKMLKNRKLDNQEIAKRIGNILLDMENY